MDNISQSAKLLMDKAKSMKKGWIVNPKQTGFKIGGDDAECGLKSGVSI